MRFPFRSPNHALTHNAWMIAAIAMLATTYNLAAWSTAHAQSGEPVEPAQAATEPAAPAANPRVVLETDMGQIVIELYPDKAPKTVENFLSYVESDFYPGTVFHRVIPGFMVQGGGFTADMTKKTTKAGVQNEADNGLRNDRGTVAMARTNHPHSATTQFFVNLVDNGFLNHRGKNPRGWGYAVFGRVVDGMSVVDAIAGVKTGNHKRMQNVPIEPITLKKIKLGGHPDRIGPHRIAPRGAHLEPSPHPS